MKKSFNIIDIIPKRVQTLIALHGYYRFLDSLAIFDHFKTPQDPQLIVNKLDINKKRHFALEHIFSFLANHNIMNRTGEFYSLNENARACYLEITEEMNAMLKKYPSSHAIYDLFRYLIRSFKEWWTDRTEDISLETQSIENYLLVNSKFPMQQFALDLLKKYQEAMEEPPESVLILDPGADIILKELSKVEWFPQVKRIIIGAWPIRMKYLEFFVESLNLELTNRDIFSIQNLVQHSLSDGVDLVLGIESMKWYVNLNDVDRFFAGLLKPRGRAILYHLFKDREESSFDPLYSMFKEFSILTIKKYRNAFRNLHGSLFKITGSHNEYLIYGL